MTAVKERPILFSAPMVRAILSGRKTQTRRVIKPQPQISSASDASWRDAKADLWRNARQYARDCCPYGQIGDVLWVRETWRAYGRVRAGEWEGGVEYRADLAHRVFRDHAEWKLGRDWCANRKTGGWGTPIHMTGGWGTPIHMPRWASRITLEITDVRVERLQETTGKDVAAEGFPFSSDLDQFKLLWDDLNAKRGFGWDANPWVWVLSFRRVEVNGPYPGESQICPCCGGSGKAEDCTFW